MLPGMIPSLGLSATGAVAAAYQIARSLRFVAARSMYISRTMTVTGDRRVFTTSFWYRRTITIGNDYFYLFHYAIDANNFIVLQVTPAGNLRAVVYLAAAVPVILVTSAAYLDPSAWMHICFSIDTRPASPIVMLEVNVAVAPWASGGTMTLTQNALLSCNCAGAYNFIGVQNGGGYYLDGYLAEVNTVDGLAQPASAFGLSDPVTGVWSPKKYIGTYGTNGYRLDFSDNSTVPNLLLDRSGNANNFGQSGVSVTPGTSNDSLFDSPTNYTDAGGVAHGKYATWSQLLLSYTVTNHGNLYTYNADTNPDQSLLVATIGVSSGKWVWEHTIITNGSAGSSPRIGAVRVIPASGVSLNPGSGTCLGFGYLYNGLVQVEGVNFATVSAMVANDAIRFELDLDAHTCAIFRNNTLQITLTGLIAGTYTPGVSEYGNSQTWTNFGQRPFANTPNAGFKTLCTQNLASAPTPALPASFIGNASASGPFIWAGGVVNSVTINGNVATRGAHFDGLSNGIRLKTASASFNASGTNTITAATYGASVKYSRAQGNP